jgi:hypothetical protein
MHGADTERQKDRRVDTGAQRIAVNRDMERGRPERHAEQHRGRNQRRVPHDAAADHQRGHADIVHRGNADTDERAAQQRIGATITDRGEPQAAADDGDGYAERDQRHRQVVADRHAGVERQHGDEVRRPDAEANRGGGDAEPHFLHRASGAAGVGKQRDAGKGRKGTDQRRKGNDAQVVMLEERREYCLQDGGSFWSHACKEPVCRMGERSLARRHRDYA